MQNTKNKIKSKGGGMSLKIKKTGEFKISR